MSLAAADFSQIPMSQNLGTTLARASDVANAFGAAEVALEHMLLALCDDPDAEAVLVASRVDVQHLKAETHAYLNGLPRQQAGPGFGVSQALSRILEAAAAAARGSRRRDINGAIVLAAIVGDGRSAAAQILQVHGLTFDEAIRALQAALAAPGRETVPEIKPADDVLARARERVQSRAAPGLRDMMRDASRPVPPPPPPAPPQMSPPSVATEAFSPTGPEPGDIPQSHPAPSVDHTLPSGDVAATAHPAAVDDAAIASPEPDYAEAAIGGDRRIEPTLPQSAPPSPARPAEPAALPKPPMTAAVRPAQATDFGYSTTPQPQPPQPPPPRAPTHAAPGPAFDLQRPVPIAMPPPIPSMGAPSAPADYRGGMPGMSPGAPNPGYGPQSMPPQQRGPAPGFPGDPFGYPQQMPPYDPSRSAPPSGPSIGPANAPPIGPPIGPHANAGAPLPSSARDMHMPMPAGPMPSGPKTAPLSSPGPSSGQPQRRAARTQIETGQLSENIPRAMRVGKTESIEVRIGKATAKAITQGLEGGGVAWRHELTVTQAMSVRLRAPEGGFFVETASPETQWIENNLGLGSDDFASWRFHITPQERGWSRLQIIVSARTIGSDGMAAETALPDQLIDVKVKTNYKRTLARWTGWTLAAIVGGILAKFGEGTFSVLAPLVEKFMK